MLQMINRKTYKMETIIIEINNPKVKHLLKDLAELGFLQLNLKQH